MGEAECGIHTHPLQRRSVITEQLWPALLYLIDAYRQHVDQPVGSAGSNLVKYAFYAESKLRQVSRIAAKKGHTTNDSENDSRHHQRGQQCHRHNAPTLASEMLAQARGNHMHQLEHQ